MLICISRRYGIVVPAILTLALVTMNYGIGSQQGDDYYFSHLWLVGLTLVFCGLLIGLITYIVTPVQPRASDVDVDTSPSVTDPSLSITSLSKMDIEAEDGTTSSTLTRAFNEDQKNHARRLLTEADKTNMFCFVPMNVCAIVITVVGLLIFVVDGFLKLLGF
jgi:hypothetical protein